jgi:hypothetical protein
MDFQNNKLSTHNTAINSTYKQLVGSRRGTTAVTIIIPTTFELPTVFHPRQTTTMPPTPQLPSHPVESPSHPDELVVKWQYSRAKEMLVEKLTNGDIRLTSENLGPREVYDKDIDGEFKKYKYKHFRANLLSLREAIPKSIGGTGTDTPPQPPPEPWRFSRAKEIITELLENGDLPLDSTKMKPKKVYDLNIDGEFWQYKYENFRTNLLTLLKAAGSAAKRNG